MIGAALLQNRIFAPFREVRWVSFFRKLFSTEEETRARESTELASMPLRAQLFDGLTASVRLHPSRPRRMIPFRFLPPIKMDLWTDTETDRQTISAGGHRSDRATSYSITRSRGVDAKQVATQIRGIKARITPNGRMPRVGLHLRRVGALLAPRPRPCNLWLNRSNLCNNLLSDTAEPDGCGAPCLRRTGPAATAFPSTVVLGTGCETVLKKPRQTPRCPGRSAFFCNDWRPA